MSSEISIEAPGRLKTASPDMEAGFGRPGSAADDGFKPWHFFVLSSILLATAGVMFARQASPESLILISLTIAAAGFAAAAFYRMLAPLTQPFVLRMGEPVSERTRAALEREKMLVLRTIKELEFDRSMGKLAQKDFDEMATRLRARAVSLMKQLDVGAGAYTALIEQEVGTRLAKKGRLPSTSLRPGKPAPTGRLAPAAAGLGGGRLQPACACGTLNDVDAAFCKKCGARLSA